VGGVIVAREGGFLHYDRQTQLWVAQGTFGYTDRGMTAVSMSSDGGYGTVVGETGALLETIFDGLGGMQWSPLGLPGLGNSYGVHVIPDPTGIAAKFYGWYVGKSSDFYFYQTNPAGEGCGREGSRQVPCWGTFNTGLRTTGDIHYRSVFLLNKNYGWTVGDGMAIAHWNGQRWKEYPEGHVPFISQLDPNLYAVGMAHSGVGWAVGQNGTILRYTGP
jgi:hypothetical protein